MNDRCAAPPSPGRGHAATPAILLYAALSILHPGPGRGAAAQAAQVAKAPGGTEALARQATFIFAGTLMRMNASTMKAVHPTESTAVVRVDDIIEAPRAPPDLAGQEVTVQLLEPASMKAGQRAVFFTRGWLLGSSIAVIEVGHVAGAEAAPRLRREVRTVRQKQADEELQAQLATAEAVVAGTVVSVRPAKIPHIGSEHDPDWYEAEIKVESVLKQPPAGSLPQGAVTLLFPHSDDVMWKDSSKYHEGERGIWLLHRNQARLPGIEDRYTALKALDFRPSEELQRLQRLLRTAS